MQKSILKLVASLLTLFILMSLVGCGGVNNAVTGTESVTGTSGTEAAKTAVSTDPITLTMIQLSIIDSDGIQNDEIAQYIREKTGISMDITRLIDANQTAVMLASGDVPDLIFCEGLEDPIKFIRANLVIDMEPYIDISGPTFKNDPRVAYSKECLSDGQNKLYWMPILQGPEILNHTINVNYTVRWDLYAKLGYPEMNEPMDLIPVLKKMQELEPVNHEGKKNYALGMANSGYMYELDIGMCFIYGVSQDPLPGLVQLEQANVEVSSLILNKDSVLWKAMDFNNTAFREGILDPESAIQNPDQYAQKATELRYLACIPYYNLGNYKTTLEALNLYAEKDFAVLPPFKTQTACFVGYGESPFGGNRYWAISSKCKAPERAMQLLNFFNDEDELLNIWNGPQGKYWEIVDGKPQATQALKDGYLKGGTDFLKSSGFEMYGYFNAFKSGGYIHSKYNVPIRFYKADPSFYIEKFDPVKFPIKFDSVNRYGAQYQNQLVEIFGLTPLHDDRFITNLLPTPPDDIKLIDAKLKDYVYNSCYAAIFIEDKNEFEKAKEEIVKGCYELGIQKSVDYWMPVYAEAIKKMESFKK